MRKLLRVVVCDACSTHDQSPGFVLAQSVRVKTAGEREYWLDVCVDCKAQGVFACPNCKNLHATGGQRSLYLPRLADCPRDEELIDKTP